LFQVLSALDILQPPHLDFFQEMYPLLIPHFVQWSFGYESRASPGGRWIAMACVIFVRAVRMLLYWSMEFGVELLFN
jgi:hypothetical protein